MITRFKKITARPFVRNVAIVATGTAGAQAISMGFAPVITRMYGPEAFGMLGTFMAILGVATPIAALTYPIAIVLPKSDADARNLMKLSAGLALIISAMVALILLVAGNWIAQALSLEAIASLLLLIPLFMVLSAYQQILAQWLIRKKRFQITARVAVIQALAINSAKTGVGLTYPMGTALIVLSTLGQALHVLLLWLGIKGNEAALLKVDERTGSILDLAKRHRDFPLYRAPQVALNAFSLSLPVLMLASFFGPPAAGFYTLGRTVLGIPSQLIGKSVADVFYPRITEAVHKSENISKLLLKATLIMLSVGALPFGLIILLGPWLFSFAFGSEWAIAGEYARWLALWSYFGFLNRPSVAAIAALGLQGFFLVYEILSVLLRALSLFIGFWIFESDIIAVALFSISGVVMNTSLVLYTLNQSKRFSPK